MKTVNIIRSLGITTLSCIALVAGSAQARGEGHPNPYLPVSVSVAPQQRDHYGVDDRFQRDFASRHEGVGNIDLRQQSQFQRIRDGIANGQISRDEARDLLWEQREIERAQRRYLADGRLSRAEWISLDRMLDRAAGNIREEKHDRNWR